MPNSETGIKIPNMETPGPAKDGVLVTEIPSYLKTLARLVARGFYQIEDSLIVDMLVRNQCKKDIYYFTKNDNKIQ